MLIFKFAGVVLVLLSSILLGYCIKLKEKVSINHLENLLITIEIIYSESTASLEDIPHSFVVASESAIGFNKKIYNEFAEKYSYTFEKSISKTWTECLTEAKLNTVYNQSELKVINDFGILLGQGNVDTQKNNIDKLKNELNRCIHLRIEQLKRKDASAKLLFYFAIFLIILLF